MTILAAVEQELDGSEGVEVSLALRLASVLDDPKTPSQAVAMNAARLLDTMVVIRARRVGKVSPLDEIRARRDAAVARLPAAPDSARSGGRRAS